MGAWSKGVGGVRQAWAEYMGLVSVLRQQGDSEGLKQGLETGSDLRLELLLCASGGGP